MKFLVSLFMGAALGAIVLAQEPVKVVPDAKVEAKPGDGKPSGDETDAEKLAKAKADYDKAYRDYMTKRQASQLLAKEIYEKDPKSDAALLAVEVMMQTGGLTVANSAKLYADVAANHYANPKIKPLLAALNRSAGEPFLMKVLEKNTDKSVQAQACFMIAEAASALVDREKDPKKSDEIAEKALKYFERAKAEFGDVIYQNDKMAHVADGAMFSLKFLRPGKPAPDIEGPDMDEKTFKLSDYKGKVVMLDFWGHW
ncbi:MAG: redoxin domain-containing protein [Gemmataceae bacterium]